MNRKLFVLVSGALFFVSAVAHAAVYDNVYWVGGTGEWTGDVTASPEYATGHWSSDPNAATGLPARLALGRTDGIRVGQVIGNGGYDLDRVPCGGAFSCSGTTGAGVQIGTDLYIGGAGTVVSYNPNRQLLSGDDSLDRFGDWRIQPDANFPGTPVLSISGGAAFEHTTGAGGDQDGMWTRWNGAELNIDGAGSEFRRNGIDGFAGGAFMLDSYHGYPGQIQTQYISNGGKLKNQGQVWYGISGDQINEETQPGIRVVTTINGGHMDLSGGDQYALDNDNFTTRCDLCFIYNFKHDADPTNDELYVINFTGPGSITVDGRISNTAEVLDIDGQHYSTQAEVDAAFLAAGETVTGRGGIRVAVQKNTVAGPSDYGDERNIQRSYQYLWNLGILRANNKSGLTGDVFSNFFTTTGNPGDMDYKLTSLLPSPAPNGKWKGDFNANGTVGSEDFVLWRKTLGSETDLTADGNQSLNIDQADRIHWRDNFGAAAPGSGAGLSGAVPEPGAMMLMIAGLSALWVFKRR